MRSGSGRAAIVAFAVALALAPIARGVAQPAPYHRYRTLNTPHFRVHTTPELEREGRVVAAAAELAYAQLSRELVSPRGMIDVVVSNDADYSNGWATPYPSNRIVVFVHPPLENEGLRVDEAWLTLVVTHELTHIFHLDRTRGIWAVGQRVFGRAPILFPNSYGPSWLTEGLAVYYESRLTEGGRLKGAQQSLLARAGAREGRLLRLDQLSLGSPGFPGGDAAYAYGALFVDYLARTRGDSAVRRFVERQSGQTIPLLLNRAAVRGFGVSFSEAFATWRDSVMRGVDTATAPLPGWRQLTDRSLYAPSPRWLNDSTIVYSATDGRDVNAAYVLTTSGVRTRLGRRDGPGANVPLADGSLLYSALDYTTPAEVRSDLYRSWPDGHTTRLTRGRSLSQPDARADGTIVAVHAGADSSDLVILRPDGGEEAVLRAGAESETWSEPRWSPDGTRIAAVHRRRDESYALEVIEVCGAELRHCVRGELSEELAPAASNAPLSWEVDRGTFLIASPSWTADGKHLVYVTEERGVPQLASVRAPMRGRDRAMWKAAPRDGATLGIFRPELSPNGELLAAVSLRADGYHVGVTETRLLPVLNEPVKPVIAALRVDLAGAPRDTGSFRPYSPWRSLAPRYWFPVIETGGGYGTKFGASTSGEDVLGRHLYSVYAAVPTSGAALVGGLFYRYAGLRRPLLDVGLTQDWTSHGRIFDPTGVSIGTLVKRTQDASLTATFVRPRVRSYAYLSMGLGTERRRWATDPAPVLSLLDTSFARGYAFPRAFVGAAWGNARRPALSISPEDGVSLAFTARERLRADAPSSTASLSVVATTVGYRSLDLPGFAHHVLALRLAGGWADRKSATALEVGGTSGSEVGVIPGFAVGEGRRTFGVRGFESAAVYGTRAAAGSLEYRAPLMVGGRGLGLLSFFFDRASITAFADAGVATCGANPLYLGICSPSPLIGRTIASTGAEVVISAALLNWDAPQALRIGVARPVVGRELTGASVVSPYVAFGLSY